MNPNEYPHPLTLRDATNPVCPTCGKSRYQTAVPVSRRGNFRHGGTTATFRSVGAVCQCDVKPEPVPLPADPGTARKPVDLADFFRAADTEAD